MIAKGAGVNLIFQTKLRILIDLFFLIYLSNVKIFKV